MAGNTLFLSPSRLFRVQWNEKVTGLPEGVFGDVSFEHMVLENAWNLSVIHPGAVLQSKDRLQHLQIHYTPLEDFSWEILPQLANLLFFDFTDSSITTLPALHSPTLQSLALWNNHISTVEVGWSAPNLEVLIMGESNCSE